MVTMNVATGAASENRTIDNVVVPNAIQSSPLPDTAGRSQPPARWYNVCPRGNDAQLGRDSPGAENAARSSPKGSGTAERGSDGFGRSRESGRKVEPSAGGQKAETYVSGCPQTNRSGSACTLGETESGKSKQVKRQKPRIPASKSFVWWSFQAFGVEVTAGNVVSPVNQKRRGSGTLCFTHFGERPAAAVQHTFRNDS